MENTISVNDYKNIEEKIDSMRSEEEIIEVHKKLIGKSCKSDYYEIKDCGVEFIKKLLSRDWGRSIVYYYSQGANNFINSKYLSDYFKNSIKELLSNEELSEETINVLNSDKLINDMTEEEIKLINSYISDFYEKTEREKITNIAGAFISYLYKLNGKGVISFIKNNISNTCLASNILLTSGLLDRASYYSGRGVNRGDLSERNLDAIFEKLLKFDKNYAIQFARMIKKMKTLGATEFIDTFMNFAYTGFNLDNLEIKDSNYSLNGVYGKSRDVVAMFSIFDAMSRGNDTEYQIIASEEIKSTFLLGISSVLMKIDPEYDYDFDGLYINTLYGKLDIRKKYRR